MVENSDTENEYFSGLCPKELGSIIEKYEHRKFDEDLLRINSFGGIESILSKLRVDIDTGIDLFNTQDIQKRIKQFSENKRIEPEEETFCDMVKEALGDTFIQILIVAAVVQISIGLSPLAQSSTDWIDGLAIVSAILIVVITSSVTNYKKVLKFRELSKHNDSLFTVAVRRKGKQELITNEELLVGDIVKLDCGMILPVDGLLIEGDSVCINESSITGESDAVFKENLSKCLSKKVSFKGEKNNHSLPSPVLISSTVVESGSGWFLVIAVHKHSIKGKITESVIASKTDKDDKTPLEIKLEDIAEDIGLLGLVAALLTLIALLIKLGYSKYTEYIFLYNKYNGTNSTSDSISNNGSLRFLENVSNVSNYSLVENITNSSLLNNTNIFSNSTVLNNSEIIASNSTNSKTMTDPYSIFYNIHKEILTILMLCVAIIVVAIPEGLPLAVTLALSFSVNKMMEEHNMVRHLSACETMGGANYILTDKTGTLTLNKMVVNNIHDGEKDINLQYVSQENYKNSSIKQNPLIHFTERYFQIIKEGILSNIDVEVDEEGKHMRGSQTDYSLYSLMHNFDCNPSKYISQIQIKERLPFNSSRKRMTSLLDFRKLNITSISGNPDNLTVHSKGAVEYILNSCDSYIDSHSCDVKKMNNKFMENINKQVEEYASKSLRCIALAYKEIPKNDASKFKDSINTESGTQYLVEQDKYSFICLVAISDGLKKAVPESVKMCHKAGINVIMITGDNIQTALSIATQSNIISENMRGRDGISMTGEEFYSKIGGVRSKTKEQINTDQAEDDEDMVGKTSKKFEIGNLEEFEKITKNLKVLARARAIDKFALVLGLKELDNVVAVTGDGSNDAQALSKADVGFAMGIQGTEAAKQAADIIIMNDDFSSVISSILWGRNIFDNIRKFLQFQLSVNLSAVILVFITSCIGSESPISAIQMLWLNLIMDSLGSLALATESPTKDLLNRKPHSKREYLINGQMWKHIISQSIAQFTIVFLLYLFAQKYIIEEDLEKIQIFQQIENCFGDFSAEIVKYNKNKVYHYIIDGKKSKWNPLHLINEGLSPEYCIFYDESKFMPGQIKNLEDVYIWYVSEFGNTAHMTIVFNCFVLYSIFNQLNSRILDGSFNIFKRIHENLLFIFVFLLEIIVQVLLVQYGGIAFKCSKGGLTIQQWGICIACASITFVVCLLTKLIPLNNQESDSINKSRNSSATQLKQNLIMNEDLEDNI